MSADPIRLFLSGDVMLGRGIDQILSHPSDPQLHEPFATNALEYVSLAESRSGPIPRSVGDSYVWGDALSALECATTDVRIVNLETSVTTSDDYWAGKGINYRMHPDNLPCLAAVGIDCCVLANNHVLDWGYAGLVETLESLHGAGIRTAGAGIDDEEAAKPAVIKVGSSRVLIFAYSSETSGTPRAWAALSSRPGLNLLRGHLEDDFAFMAEHVAEHKRPGDIAVLSIHWGSNWGYAIPLDDRQLAHRLIDEAGADIVYGHSSHHPKGIETHAGKLVLYGCGDLLNDYEGIAGREEYRGDLSLMYLATLAEGTGELVGLEMAPMSIRRFKLNRCSPENVDWLRERLDRECRALGGRVELSEEGRLMLRA